MPNAVAVACRCGQLNCQQHTAKSTARSFDERRGSASSRGYNHRWSTKLRPMVLRRDPLCKDPFKVGCQQISKIGDHVIPKAAGGTDSLDNNLQGLCDQCHNRKIALEKRVTFIHSCSCAIKTHCLINGLQIALSCLTHAQRNSFAVKEWTCRVTA